MAQIDAVGLLEDLARVRALATAAAASPQALAANLRHAYEIILYASPHDYAAGHVRSVLPELMRGLFDLRLELRARAAEWKGQGLLTREVQRGVRDIFRIARYGIDHLGEISIGHVRLDKDAKPGPAFAGADLQTFRHPSLDRRAPIRFESGDVLLMRGSAHNSAAIARIGDMDSQFSHIAMVRLGPDNEAVVVESLIEEGAIVNTLAHALDHGVGRMVLYRHKDRELARTAADLIHDHVKRSRARGGRHIHYDFTMRLKGYRTLFCSKLIRQAFDLASKGRTLLPSHPTRFEMKNRDFLKRIGVKTSETFAPADMDLETDFDLLAEWQDYRVTARLRLQDLIMDKLFEWMDRYDYKFREDLIIYLIAFLGRLAGQLSDRAKNLIADVVPKVPPNMRQRTIAAVAMLHKTAEPILARLEALDRETIASQGRALYAREIYDHLEAHRLAMGRRIGYLVGRA